MHSEVINTTYSFSTVFKDLNFKQELIYGSLAGLSITLIGHPFDTVKTCMQYHRTSLGHTVKTIVRNNGLFGFYKGVASPLYTSALLNAIVFGVYECSRTLLSQHYELPTDSYSIIAPSACLAGFFNSFFVAPFELFKVKLQMETQSSKKSGYKQVLAKIYRTGGMLGIFRGLSAAMVRDCISYPFQFASYSMSLKYMAERDLEKKNRLSHFIVGGGIGGFFCWASTYPIDTVKTIIQAKPMINKIGFGVTGEIYSTAKDIYKRQGCNGLFAGFTACLGRALIANSCGFLTWEASKNLLKY